MGLVKCEVSCEQIQITKRMIPSKLTPDGDNYLTQNALCGSLWFRLHAQPRGHESRVKHLQHC